MAFVDEEYDFDADQFVPISTTNMPVNHLNNSMRRAAGQKMRNISRTAGLLNSSLNSSLSASLSSTMDSVFLNEMERKRNNASTPGSARSRRTPRSTTEASLGGPPSNNSFSALDEQMEEETEQLDPEFHVQHQLQGPLNEVSRQRLRAVQMSLRRYGCNLDCRITTKDLQQVFQEHNIKIPSRLFQMIVDIYQDHKGIDYERLYRCLVKAQSRTGRDSVIAVNARNDLETSRSQSTMTSEQRDSDLVTRLEKQMTKSEDIFDLQELRNGFQLRDTNKTGKLEKKDMLGVCEAAEMPIYGALLNSLMKRCDDELNGMISWPEVMSFLEKAWQSYVDKNPSAARSQTAMSLRQGVHQVQFSVGEEALSLQGNQNSVDTDLDSPDLPIDILEQIPEDTARESLSSESETSAKGVHERDKASTQQNVPASSLPTSNPSQSSLSSQSSSDSSQSTSKRQSSQQLAQSGRTQSAQSRSRASPPQTTLLQTQSDSKLSTKEHNAPAVTVTAPVSQTEDQSTARQPLFILSQSLPATKFSELSQSQEGRPSTAKNEKTEKSKFKNKAEPVRSASGFLASLKNKVTGKKADDSTIPLVEVADAAAKPAEEKTKEQSAPTPAPQASPKRTGPEPNTITTKIKGKSVTYYVPDEYINKDTPIDPPKERLQLEWVYGYRGNDCRSNIYVTASGEILYFIAHVAILYNKEQHAQRHYREHTEEIKCMSLHSNGVTVATGQVCGKHAKEDNAHIRIWRSDTLQTVHVLGTGTFNKGVICLAFPKIKDRLIAIDNSPDHVLSVWDVASGKELGKTTLGVDVVCDVGLNPKNPSLVVTTGREHLAWWKLYPESGVVEMHMKPDYEKNMKARFIICMMHNDRGDLITGDSNGTIYVWGYGGNVITNYVKHAHDGPVFTLLMYRGTLLSGGRDGMLYSWTWNKNMDKTGQLAIPPMEGGLRMIQMCKDQLLLGTTMNSMLTTSVAQEGPPLAGAVLDTQPLTQGHFDDLRALTAIPSPECPGLFLTAGYDGIICMYDAHTKLGAWKHFMKNVNMMCVDANPSESLLVIGTKDSNVLLLELGDNQGTKEPCKSQVGKGRLNSVKFSQDCKLIAAASQDKNIYILQVQVDEENGRTLEVIGKCEGVHSTMSLDWSSEKLGGSYILRTSSSALDYICWNVNSCSQISNHKLLRNLKWKSQQCRVGFSVAGLWNTKRAKECDITAVDATSSQSALVVGDSEGYVSVFRYPACKSGTFSHTYRGHQNVYNICLTSDNKHVVTVGGRDACIMQWKVV